MNLLMMPTLHVGQGTHLGGLSVFPVWTDAPIVSGLATGRAARVQVAEREGSRVVGELVLKNEGAKPALWSPVSCSRVDGSTGPSTTTSCWCPASSWWPACPAWSTVAGTAPRLRCDGPVAPR